MKTISYVFVCLLATAASHSTAADNQLTDKEKQDGWHLLFDGKTTNGWMSIKKENLPESHVQDGALNPHPCNYMLVYEQPLTDYVLSLDFKISPKCNSGVFFRTSSLEPKKGYDVGFNGLEIAIDDTQTDGYVDTGAIYDLSKPTKNAMKPVGEWNHLVLMVQGPKVSIDVNGERVNDVDFDQFAKPGERPDGSKHKFSFIAYKDHPRTGYIGLQDHGSDCWFKNIKLKTLPAAKTK